MLKQYSFNKPGWQSEYWCFDEYQPPQLSTCERMLPRGVICGGSPTVGWVKKRLCRNCYQVKVLEDIKYYPSYIKYYCRCNACMRCSEAELKADSLGCEILTLPELLTPEERAALFPPGLPQSSGTAVDQPLVEHQLAIMDHSFEDEVPPPPPPGLKPERPEPSSSSSSTTFVVRPPSPKHSTATSSEDPLSDLRKLCLESGDFVQVD